MTVYGTRTRSNGSAYNSIGIVTLQSMTDVVTEGYATKSENGELINNPLSSVRYHAFGPTTLFVRSDLAYSRGWAPTFHEFRKYRTLCLTSSQLNKSTIEINAMAICDECGVPGFSVNDKALLNKSVDAEIGSGLAQLYVTLAESGKTASMFVRAYRLLTKSIIEVRRELRIARRMMRTAEGRKRVLDRVGDYWLEGRYGWRPFVFDVMSIFEAKTQQGRPVRFTARDGLTRNGEKDFPTFATFAHNYQVPYGYSKRYKVQRKLSVGSTVDYGLDFSTSAGLDLGLTDILGTAWELVPFSFVVDRFINIGDNLQALQAFALAKQRIAWLTETINVEVSYQTFGPRNISVAAWPHTNPTLYSTQVISGHDEWNETAVIKTRIPRTDFLPDLGFRFNVDTAFAVDAYFLFRSVLGLGKRSVA